MTSTEKQGDALVLREDVGRVARLTLNRSAQRNSLSSDLMSALQAALDGLQEDREIGAIVLASTGPAFSAGHDLKELRANPERAFYERLFAQCSRMMTTIVRHPKPVIAEVQGVATAAGCQLVASCDLAVAVQGAKFATPGVNIGLFCSTPMVALSRNVSRKQAMEMLLLGDMMDADTALRFGLVNRVVPGEGLVAETMAMAKKIADKSPLTLRVGKEAFYRQLELPLDDAYREAGRVMVENMLARDASEGIDAFLQKRSPTWQGC